MKFLATPPVTADTNTIQNLFMQIVRDIKKNAESASEAKQAATTEVLKQLRENLAKNGESIDLSKLTAEDLTVAVMKTISQAGIPEEKLSSLSTGFLDLLNALNTIIDLFTDMFYRYENLCR